MKTSLNHEDAFAFVQARRFCVAPRGEFVHQLEVCFSLVSFCSTSLLTLSRVIVQNYRPILLAAQTVAADRHAQSSQRARRRGREDDDEGQDDDGNDSMSSMNGGMSNGGGGM